MSCFSMAVISSSTYASPHDSWSQCEDSAADPPTTAPPSLHGRRRNHAIEKQLIDLAEAMPEDK